MVDLTSRYHGLGCQISQDKIPSLRQCIRVNTLKITSDRLVSLLRDRGVVIEPVTDIVDAFYADASFSLASTIEYLKGYFYIQGVASQLPAFVLLDGGRDCGSSILDMCAAPGSKTTHLASLTGDDIPLVACDSDGSRLKALEFNLERMGISSISTFRKDARFVNDLGLSFDRILLDAPCSGNYVSDPSFFSRRSVLDFKNRARLQKSLLHAAYDVLSPGGILVYSTCSLEPEENELVIDWFLEEYDDIDVLETGLARGDPGLTDVFGRSLDNRISYARRFWPPKTDTEGFFIVKLKKALE